MPNLLEYIQKRRHDKAIITVRAAMRGHGRITYGELWAETGLRQSQLDQTLTELVAADEVRVYDDPQTARKMVELRYRRP